MSVSEGVGEERVAGGWVCDSGGDESVEEVVKGADEGAVSGIGASGESSATEPAISASSSSGGPGSASSSP